MSALADFSEHPEEEARPLLEEVADAAGPGRLIARWVPDPRGGDGLICAWTREPEAGAGDKGTDGT
jgi:hypothetical protein